MAKVLVMLPNNSGDVLMATPALRILKKNGHAVHFLVDSECQEMVAHNPNIEKLHVLPRQAFKAELAGENWKAGIARLKEFLAGLYQEKFEKVVNLFQGNTTAYIASLIDCGDFTGTRMNAKGKPVLAGEYTALLYAIPFSRKYVPAHACDLYTLMCGAKPDGQPAELFLSKEAEAFAQNLLAENNFNPARLVVIHPCSAHLKKEWPHSHIIILIRFLLEAGYRVVFTGSQQDRNRVDAIVGEFPQGTINLCGRTSFLQAAGVIKEAAWLVSSDTVAMHLASALGTKVIAIFAPTSLLEIGPYAADSVIFRSDCFCFGSHKGECPLNQKCTGQITPQYVFEEIEGRTVAMKDGCRRYTSYFNPETGFIDYVDSAGQGYAPVARALVQTLTDIPMGDKVQVSDAEQKSMERLLALLQENADCLNRLKRTRDRGDVFTELLKKNREIERNINGLSGIGAFLAAFLRFTNNSISSEALAEIAEGMIENARRLFFRLERMKDVINPHVRTVKKPLVTIIVPLSRSMTGQADYRARLQENIAYSNFQLIFQENKASLINSAAEKADGQYLLFLDNNIHTTPGFLDEMYGIIEKDLKYAACTGKVLKENDTVLHTGMAFNQERRPVFIYRGLKRYNSEVILFREVQAAAAMCMLVRKAAFVSTGGFDTAFSSFLKDVDLCLRFKQAGYRLIYCPDAEVYYMGELPDLYFEDNIRNDETIFNRKWFDKIVPNAHEYV